MASEPAVSERIGEAEVKERLDAADLAAADLIAATHQHRYELAAALVGDGRVLDLCCGTGYGARIIAAAGAEVHGVDVAEEAVSAARDAGGERVTFERADALEFLRRTGAGAFDAIVCFEGMEHVPDPGAVADQLARLAEGGARLVLSFPNSRGFDERNRFHVTDFGWEETQRLIERFDSPVVLEQYLAEGSVIVPAGERPADARARLLGEPERDDPAWAGNWVVLVGVGDDAARAAGARLATAAAPHQNAYMRDLERANHDLRRANALLAREQLGVHDAAAASMVRRLQEAEARAEAAEADAKKWREIADNNDWARQERQLVIDELEERLALPRYAAIDTMYERIERLPGGKAALNRAGRLFTRTRAGALSRPE